MVDETQMLRAMVADLATTIGNQSIEIASLKAQLGALSAMFEDAQNPQVKVDEGDDG